MTDRITSPNAMCRLNNRLVAPCTHVDDGNGRWRLIVRFDNETPILEPVRVEVEFSDGTLFRGNARYVGISNTFGVIEHELEGVTPLASARTGRA